MMCIRVVGGVSESLLSTKSDNGCSVISLTSVGNAVGGPLCKCLLTLCFGFR